MSGHSKWSTIKRKKGAIDAKRGKVFTRVIKELTIAARMGGGNPDANPRLRTAMAAAKAENMPKDNIERAIKKGSGELEGTSYEEITYEGYGPGGAAVMVEVMTDNKNRSAADIRNIFSKNNGTLGETNCVGYMFDKKGVIVYEKDAVDEDQLMEAALEAGADDIVADESTLTVLTAPQDFYVVKEALDVDEAVSGYESAEISMVPQNTVQLTGKHSVQVLRMMDAFDDNDDVQNAYSNFDISDEEMEKMG